MGGSDGRQGRGRPALPPGRNVALPGRGTTFVRELAGPEGAPTLLLLHGWTATADLNWFACFEPLAEHFRVVALDHRGHGRGLRGDDPFRLEDCADDAAALARRPRDRPGRARRLLDGWADRPAAVAAPPAPRRRPRAVRDELPLRRHDPRAAAGRRRHRHVGDRRRRPAGPGDDAALTTWQGWRHRRGGAVVGLRRRRPPRLEPDRRGRPGDPVVRLTPVDGAHRRARRRSSSPATTTSSRSHRQLELAARLPGALVRTVAGGHAVCTCTRSASSPCWSTPAGGSPPAPAPSPASPDDAREHGLACPTRRTMSHLRPSRYVLIGMMNDAPIDAAWREHRARVLDIAVRMLGSVSEAEDVVQERVRTADAPRHGRDRRRGRLARGGRRAAVPRRAAIGPPAPPASRRTCEFDDLARRRRHTTRPTGSRSTRASSRRCTSCWRRMSPAERTAFVLHDVFQVPFEEVAAIVGRTPAACRQLATRARRRAERRRGGGPLRGGAGRATHPRRPVHRRLPRRATSTGWWRCSTRRSPDRPTSADARAPGEPSARTPSRRDPAPYFGPGTGVDLVSLPARHPPVIAAIQRRRAARHGGAVDARGPGRPPPLRSSTGPSCSRSPCCCTRR